MNRVIDTISLHLTIDIDNDLNEEKCFEYDF